MNAIIQKHRQVLVRWQCFNSVLALAEDELANGELQKAVAYANSATGYRNLIDTTYAEGVVGAERKALDATLFQAKTATSARLADLKKRVRMAAADQVGLV